MACLGSHLSFMLWYCTVTGDNVDSCFSRFFKLAPQFVPRYVGRVQCEESQKLRDLEYRSLLGDHCAGVQLSKWKQMLRDRACRVGLGLDSQSVKSTSVDAVTSRIYKIQEKGFQVVTSVSPDGKYFPSRPAEFIEEARSQAQETYGLRSLHCDVHRIREAADRVRARHLVWDSLSVHDFFLTFFSGQGRRLAVRIIGDSSLVPCVTLEEWFWVLQKSGSEATALDEMCESLLQALSSCGHQALVCWLKKLREGHFSYFLQIAIHSCLLKKVPTWLLRSRRPIVIGPVLRRRESTQVLPNSSLVLRCVALGHRGRMHIGSNSHRIC